MTSNDNNTKANNMYYELLIKWMECERITTIADGVHTDWDNNVFTILGGKVVKVVKGVK